MPVRLFLDDIRLPPDDTWTVCRTAEEARGLLLAGPIDVATLDHDLGECDECVNTFPARGYPLVTDTCRHKMNGLQLLEWMRGAGVWPRQKPSVHSLSEKGRPAMVAFIEQHWQAPRPDEVSAARAAWPALAGRRSAAMAAVLSLAPDEPERPTPERA
jgi:hypothetical protein